MSAGTPEQHMLAVANADITAGTIVCIEYVLDESGASVAWVKPAEGACLVRFMAQVAEGG